MSTSRTIQITQFGGPEVMNLVELPVGDPARARSAFATRPAA